LSSAVYTLTKPAYVTTTSLLTPIILIATPVLALPRAPGTKLDCEDYVDHLVVEPFQDQSKADNVRLLTEEVNSCNFASSAYAVSYDDFMKWNPSLASVKPCYLQQGYSYCAVDSIDANCEFNGLEYFIAILDKAVVGKTNKASSRSSKLWPMSLRRRCLSRNNFHVRVFHCHHRVCR
jgi:hypothetical protein